MIERVNVEIRRRERVVRIFPNEAARHRLISSVLVEIHEQWQERKYFEMQEYHEWHQDRQTADQSSILAFN